MRSKLLILPLCLLFICSAISAGSQAPAGKSSDQFTLTSIEVAGNQRYTRDQIASGSGLRIGQKVSSDGKTVNEEIFRDAAGTLGKSGAFSDISYRYEYSAKGTKLELHVRESDKFIAAKFDNFVWLSDSQLIGVLKERVPLFDGAVPASGALPEQVAQALQDILSERKLPGTAESIPTGPKDGPIDAITYRVSGIAIHIDSVDFPGSSPEESESLQTAAKPLRGQEYSRSTFRAQEKFNFLPVFLSHGYLKAEFADPECKLSPAANPGDILVDVVVPVTPGRQYKVAGIEWSGNTVFSNENLQAIIHLRPNEPANEVQLNEDVRAIDQFYGTRGYVEAQAVVAPKFNDVSSTVTFELALQEGDLYRMGDLKIEGLDSPTSKLVAGVWNLRAGEPFDTSYSRQKFPQGLAKGKIAIPAGMALNVEETPDPSDDTVNVRVVFAPGKSP